ncbi:MAG TPA: hypothetical protein VHT30_04230 [Acidimicrobiales bacterium]|jgi:hypothetical protein|nr:hypothetical protein [Acidimicrobiales bacterium]
MNALIRLGLRRGWQRGILNGERTWLYIGAASLLLRFLLRALHKEEAVVYREVLQAGERIVITHEPPA